MNKNFKNILKEIAEDILNSNGNLEVNNCTICKINPKFKRKDGFLHSYCKECNLQKSNNRYKTKRVKDLIFNSYLKKKYLIDIEEYNSILKKQNNLCAICKIEYTGETSVKNKRFGIDHNHVTGKIRGILCSKCNMGLGLFQDNKDNLKEAINYLKENGSYG